jgi:hypothetical protein
LTWAPGGQVRDLPSRMRTTGPGNSSDWRGGPEYPSLLSLEHAFTRQDIFHTVNADERGKTGKSTGRRSVVTDTFDDLDFDRLEREIAPRPQRFWRPIKTQRVLQLVLGVFWLLDAGLQFQSFMFHRSFVDTFILPNANGQPVVVGWVITNIGHFIEPHIALWNTLFALTQVAIGLGLLFRPTARYALALSFAWAFGVWVVGEGMGMVLTGSASALTGAPGSIFIYGMLGLMAWPAARPEEPDELAVGVASSAAARGVGGVATPLLVWAGYWSLAAVLFLLPHNRTPTSISSAIVGMAPGQPGWFTHFLTNLGNAFSSSGTSAAWVLAIVSLVIGFGPLLTRRPGVFLAAGAVLSAVMWVAGQGLLGNILTGSGTDPNTGPLIVVLALAMTPARVAAPFVGSTPLGKALREHRVLTGGGIGLVALAIFLSGAYPASSQESTGMAMSGMTGMAGEAASGNTATTAACTGSGHAGLVVNNSPLMSMGGHVYMNMNGADASAAAGLNSTKANWHYTGPALPPAEAQQLLAEGGNGPDQIHMARSGCAPEPTFSDQINAEQYVQTTSQEVASYADPSAALAAGYVAVSPMDYPVAYYVNPQIVAANAAAKRSLDPNHIDGLAYATTPTGKHVLAAAFYLLPSTVDTPPMPYGSLVQWHQRTGVCSPSGSSSAPGGLSISGSPPCTTGSLTSATPYMTMVWQVPVAGGPTAIQPPDIQIVEAAIMQAGS